MSDPVAVIFNLLLHALFLGAIVAFAVVLIRAALDEEDRSERLFRFLALFLGLMIVLGGRAAGIVIPVVPEAALDGDRMDGWQIILSALLPALVGIGLGLYVNWVFRKGDSRAFRALCLVGSLALASFVVVYATAATARARTAPRGW